MLLFISLIFLIIFIYVNTLFYSIALLLVVLGLLYIMVSNLVLQSLTMLLLIIVYVGAMMILIGYICAICPNLILTPNYSNVVLYTSFFMLAFVSFISHYSPTLIDLFLPMTAYFYSSYGGIALFFIIFILFITLLMVTSQYMTPKGPFRSVSI